MGIVRKVNMIEVSDWDNLISKTYNRHYSFQQQDDCKPRGTFNITIPSDNTDDHNLPDSVPEIINGEKMGVNFKSWLERDMSQPVGDRDAKWEIELFWERNFYPDVQTVANDLHSKGLIEAGSYIINIDW